MASGWVYCGACSGSGESPWGGTGACSECRGYGEVEVPVCETCGEPLSHPEEADECRACRGACLDCGAELEEDGTCWDCRVCCECGDPLTYKEFEACGACRRAHTAVTEYEEVGA